MQIDLSSVAAVLYEHEDVMPVQDLERTKAVAYAWLRRSVTPHGIHT